MNIKYLIILLLEHPLDSKVIFKDGTCLIDTDDEAIKNVIRDKWEEAL